MYMYTPKIMANWDHSTIPRKELKVVGFFVIRIIMETDVNIFT